MAIVIALLTRINSNSRVILVGSTRCALVSSNYYAAMVTSFELSKNRGRRMETFHLLSRQNLARRLGPTGGVSYDSPPVGHEQSALQESGHLELSPQSYQQEHSLT